MDDIFVVVESLSNSFGPWEPPSSSSATFLPRGFSMWGYLVAIVSRASAQLSPFFSCGKQSPFMEASSSYLGNPLLIAPHPKLTQWVSGNFRLSVNPRGVVDDGITMKLLQQVPWTPQCVDKEQSNR